MEDRLKRGDQEIVIDCLDEIDVSGCPPAKWQT